MWAAFNYYPPINDFSQPTPHRTRTPVNRRLCCADLCTVFCSNDSARALKNHPKVAVLLSTHDQGCRLPAQQELTPNPPQTECRSRAMEVLGKCLCTPSTPLYDDPPAQHRQPAPVHRQRHPVLQLHQVQCSYQTPRLNTLPVNEYPLIQWQ